MVEDEDKVEISEDKDRIKVVVNGRERTVTSDELSYDDVVKLAFDSPPSGPNIMITVTYRNGAGRPPEGTLNPGERVKIREGTVFNATATDKS